MVNIARLVLSSIFPAKDGTPFDNQPLIVRLLRGMFKQRPSLPRYTVTYDVAKVLQYISYSHSKMSLECLTKMLATFRWTKIPNYELIWYQPYAYRWRPLYLLHIIYFKNYKAWFPPAFFGIQEIHRPISMCYYIY